ncbi:MAG: hypothetical protein ACK5Q5_04345 [Planctomycetaceae bacterium]
MNVRLSLALAACGVVAASSGCTTPSASLRGQSPETTTTMPVGWNPHQYGHGETFYSGTESFSGAIGPYYGDGTENTRRQQRLASRGILPPPGSPYASGYVPTPRISADAQPARVVNGVKMYDVGSQGFVPGSCPPNVPWQDLRGQPYDLMPGGCPVSGADYVRWMPTHYQTFNYNRPADLTYPSQNSVGGATVYSYYTLKGPDDFFHDKDGIY